MQSLHRQLQITTCNGKKHEQTEEKRNFKTHIKNNKELNALIEKKCLKFVRKKKTTKIEKGPRFFQEMQISDDVSKKVI